MTRVVGKVVLVAVAMTLVVAASANAIGPRMSANMDLNAIPGGGMTVGPRTFMGTGLEAAEGYNLGTLSFGAPGSNGGWRSFGGANPYPPTGTNVGPRHPGTYDVVDGRFELQDGSLAGVRPTGSQGSGQSLFISQNFRFPGGTNIGNFSPTFKDFTKDTLNVDWKIDDFGGSNYTIVPQAPTQGRRITNIYFYYLGYQYILEDTDGPGPGTALTYRGVGAFLYDTWQTVEMKIDKANRTFTLRQGADKDNLVDLFYTPSGGSPVYVFQLGQAGQLGDQFEEVVFLGDNFQNTGSGPISGPEAGAYFDNIVLKPEPGTLAMLAAGAMLALRRRKAR